VRRCAGGIADGPAGITGLGDRIDTEVRHLANHQPGSRPLAGEVLVLYAELLIEVAGDLFINEGCLVTIIPFAETVAIDIEAVRSHRDDAVSQLQLIRA